MEHKKITLAECERAAIEVAEIIHAELIPKSVVMLYGVPRGGITPAYMVRTALVEVYGVTAIVTEEDVHADYFIDDIVDSGATRDRIMRAHPSKKFLALFKRTPDEPYYDFPWELNEDGEAVDSDIPVRLLQYIGEDVNRGGLAETPRRFLKAWGDWTSGYGVDPADVLKVFEDGAERCDEMVIVKDIPIYSQCEHHLAPFFGVAHIGYIPDSKIVGLSKLSRLADIFAKRLQVQERLTNDIAHALQKHLAPLGVAVVVECRHMCMESRGIQRQGSTTVTSSMLGTMREDDKARGEFLRLIGK